MDSVVHGKGQAAKRQVAQKVSRGPERLKPRHRTERTGSDQLAELRQAEGQTQLSSLSPEQGQAAICCGLACN